MIPRQHGTHEAVMEKNKQKDEAFSKHSACPSDLAKMMQDTAMNSLHESDDSDTCQANNFNYTTVANLGKAIYIRLAEMKCSLLMVI